MYKNDYGIVLMEQCVVRSYKQTYNNTTNFLEQRLSHGWQVKHVTPFIKNGDTDYIEYILERIQGYSSIKTTS